MQFSCSGGDGGRFSMDDGRGQPGGSRDHKKGGPLPLSGPYDSVSFSGMGHGEFDYPDIQDETPYSVQVWEPAFHVYSGKPYPDS